MSKYRVAKLLQPLCQGGLLRHVQDYPLMAYSRNVALICNAEVMKRQELGAHWLKMMTSSAAPELWLFPGQDEGLSTPHRLLELCTATHTLSS